MNYLAHAFLASRASQAGDDDELILGNLMGDFVRGSDLDGYPERIRHGIRMHRRIDAFTDRHPVVRRSKERFPPEHRRCAGIAVDVFYDHFLARRWLEYSTVGLGEFTQRVYALLEDHRDLLPERMRRTAERMIAEDWLSSYAETAAVTAALSRMGRRLRQPNSLGACGLTLEADYDGLESDFRLFFPDLSVRFLDMSDDAG